MKPRKYAAAESYSLENKKRNLCEKKQKNKGITLIALIITIIVLLILAGVAIASLSGENGLLKRSNQAKEEAIKAQLKEEIEMAIMDIQVEEASKGNNVTLESLAGENGEEGQLETNENLIGGGITADLEGNEITGEYKDYDYTIDGNLNVEIGGKLTSEKPVISYDLSTQDIGVTEVTITVNASVSDGTIVKITKPDKSVVENTNTTTYTVNKSGNYEFEAESSTGRKAKCIVEVRNIKPGIPVIKVLQQGGYPIFTKEGVKNGESIIEIQYEDKEILKNYYRENSGDWKEYKGKITTSATNIEAKSVIEEINLESETASSTLLTPTDALGLEGYDKNDESFNLYNTSLNIPGNNTKYNGCKFYVDKDCWNKLLKIKLKIYKDISNSYVRTQTITFIDEENNLIEDRIIKNIGTNSLDNLVTIIPSNTKSIIIYSDLSNLAIYDVSIDMLSRRVLEYPIITSNGIKNVVNIDGENMTYELDLTADECYGVGAAPKILYDGDKDTYQNMSGNPGNAGIFCIDKSAIGSIWTATVRYINSLYITTYKDFKSAKLIPGISDMRGYELGKGYDSNITITEEMKYVSIWSGSGSFSSSEVYKVEE